MMVNKNPVCYYNDVKVSSLFVTTGDIREQVWGFPPEKAQLGVEYNKLGEMGQDTPTIKFWDSPKYRFGS